MSLENILIISLIVLVIILAGLIIRLEYKLRKFLRSTGADNIEGALGAIDTDVIDLKKFRNELENYLQTVEDRLKRSTQGIHTVRFNPFKGTGSGGNQSFATALLNEHGDGVIISSLYSRDHVSVYSKPITKYDSEFELTTEEKLALSEARKKLN